MFNLMIQKATDYSFMNKVFLNLEESDLGILKDFYLSLLENNKNVTIASLDGHMEENRLESLLLLAQRVLFNQNFQKNEIIGELV
mmetsp:Transcript_22381/g.10771  ORF Transcript_22381/g.10771 Transcript_22381/m.10771 type:complete len:85 (+) Transcript_22381:1803-2057(+)